MCTFQSSSTAGGRRGVFLNALASLACVTVSCLSFPDYLVYEVATTENVVECRFYVMGDQPTEMYVNGSTL